MVVEVSTTLQDETQAPYDRFVGRQLARNPGLSPEALYGVPQDDYFKERDYLLASDLEVIANELINRCEELGHLKQFAICYLWKRKGGQHQGQANLGKCQKVTGLARHFSAADFVVWLAADHATSYELSRQQVEALLHHELCHGGEALDADDEPTGKPKPRGHDFDGFAANIRRYGAWSLDLQECRDAWQQLLLLQTDEER